MRFPRPTHAVSESLKLFGNSHFVESCECEVRFGVLFVEHGESRDGGDGSVESGEAVAVAGGEDSPVFEVRVGPFTATRMTAIAVLCPRSDSVRCWPGCFL